MKLIKYLSFLLPLFIVGCETTVGLNIDEVVTSYTESLSLTAEGGEDAIEFDIPCDWEASISEEADWLTLSEYSGNRGRNYINVTAEDNKSIEAREAVITIYNDIYEVSKEVTVYQEANDPYITLSNNELEFDKNESSKSIEVESSIPWSATIVSNPDWLTITPTKGDNGTTTLKVTVKGNNTIDNRSANIKIENSEYKLSKVLTITQSAGDATVSVSSKEISIPSEGDTKSIDIESNTPWKAKCDAEWISLSPTSGSKGKTTMSVSAEENPYTESRTATITIVDNNQKELAKINVKQGDSSAYINLSNNSIAVKFNIPYTLNIKSTVTWTAEYDADIVSVTPNSGIGKVDATITIIDQTTDSVDVRFYNDDFGVSTTLHITPDYTNCIFYTTSDGNIVSPYNSNGFGATIISNEIINGIGTIVFNNSVTTIGTEAFRNCSRLTSVTIPDSVTTIGSSAFQDCSILQEFKGKFASMDGRCLIVDGTLISFASAGLTEYTIPDSVTTIGDNAFRGCSSLTSVTIPDSVTTIGTDAFRSCTSLTSVTIPDSVTTIGTDAFRSCTSLTSVTIPDSVTTIGDSAFRGCSSLTSVTIGNSVTLIGNSAFAYCYSLTSITIPDSVTTIGDSAFSGCSSLTSITIPDSVTTIGGSAFSGCSSLTSVTIGDSVTTIGSEAFYGCTGELIINSKIVETDYTSGSSSPSSYGWLKDAKFTKLTIGDSVTTIGDNAFRGCRSLTSVTIPDSVTTIGSSAFRYCSSLTSVTIGDSVTTIGNYAFEYCSSLTSVTIPDSVTTIGEAAFSECDSLTSVTIPDSVTSIGNEVFAYCSSLQEFNGKFASEDGRYLIMDGTLISFAPAGLTEYTIPNSVTSIGNYAFSGCGSLTSVTIPDSVTTIGDNAFEDCDSLTSVIIPNSVTTIGDSAFQECSSLTSVTIPDNVTTIGSSAFNGCSSLTSVTIPDSVTTIGDAAFRGCSSLTSVTIPDSVTTIGSWAFHNCDSLTSVTIPDSVTSLGTEAFNGCSSLTSVYCKATTPPVALTSFWYWRAFDNNASGRKIYVPMESVNKYKSAEYWSDYKSDIVGYDF